MLNIFFRKWSVENGILGETCTNWNHNSSELMCTSVTIPDCVDRTILCSEPPIPDRSVMNFTSKPNLNSSKQFGTMIEYSCPDRSHFFDYPVGENFVSYYYTKNINAINVTCNHDG